MIILHDFSKDPITDFQRENFLEEVEEVPSKDLPDTIKRNIISNVSDLSDINNMALINKDWSHFISKNPIFIWEAVLKKLGTLLSPDFSTFSLKKIQKRQIARQTFNKILQHQRTAGLIPQIAYDYFRIKSIKDQIRDSFINRMDPFLRMQDQTLKDEINGKLKDLKKTQNVIELLQICKAMSHINFCNALNFRLPMVNPLGALIDVVCKQKFFDIPCKTRMYCSLWDLGDRHLIGKLKSIQEIKNLEKDFKKWCNDFKPAFLIMSEMDLSNCFLMFIPDEIELFENLVYLDLRNNGLISLTSKIGKLKKLEGLNLENNSLTTLPYTICKLETLTKINLKNNPLVSLPRILKERNVEIEFDENQLLLQENESFWTDENPDDDESSYFCPRISQFSCTIQ